MNRHLLHVAIAACLLYPRTVDADADVGVPRLSLGMDFDWVVGPFVTVDGRETSDRPGGLPLPRFFARFEVPVDGLLVLGAHAGVSSWPTEMEERLGHGSHTTLDVGLLPKLRYRYGTQLIHEWYLAVPFGVSFDMVGADDGGPPDVSYTSEWNSGFHVGFLAGHQFTWPKRAVGWFVEAGMIYRSIERTAHYQVTDSTHASSEQLRYQPISLLVGGGVLFKL